jgi:hypothetical protein
MTQKKQRKYQKKSRKIKPGRTATTIEFGGVRMTQIEEVCREQGGVAMSEVVRDGWDRDYARRLREAHTGKVAS